MHPISLLRIFFSVIDSTRKLEIQFLNQIYIYISCVLLSRPDDEKNCRFTEGILKDCKIALDLGLGLRRAVDFRYDRENILICGNVGSGKTTFCKMLIERYREAPCFVHTHMIDCRSLKGNIAPRLFRAISGIDCDIMANLRRTSKPFKNFKCV